MKNLSNSIYLALMFLFISTNTSAIVPQVERDALVALYNSTGGDNWTDNTNWLVGDPCDDGWFGVVCFGGLIWQIYLQNNQLHGQIPAELANLSDLRNLGLWTNQLTGEIPMQLSNLTNLRQLSLQGNQLTGEVPIWIGNLTNLWGLQLTGNNFTSTQIPSEFSNLINLGTLGLGGLELNGNIPSWIGALSNLDYLNLRSNKLTGEIPIELGNLSSLQRLYLDDNQLSGNIPPELGNLSSVQYITLTSNKFSGEIPFSNLFLAGLSGVYLRYNALYSNNIVINQELNGLCGCNWQATQTIAPDNLSVSNVTNNTISLAWDLIEYTQNPGRYRIWYSESPTGTYIDGGATTNKTESTFTLTSLTENTDYYIVVRTESDSGGTNQNMIISEDSNQVMATPLQISQSLIVTGQITNWDEGSGSITVGDGINHVSFYWSTAGPDSGWFYGSSTFNPDSDIAFLDSVTDISQVGDITNILFSPDTIGIYCDIDCDPDQTGDFMIGINTNTGHLAVLRIDNIESNQMNATWWFQKEVTNAFDTIYLNSFE